MVPETEGATELFREPGTNISSRYLQKKIALKYYLLIFNLIKDHSRMCVTPIASLLKHASNFSSLHH